MLKKAVEMCNDVWAIFVTKDPKLIEEVRKICPQNLILPAPDIFLTILGYLSLQTDVISKRD